MAEYRAPGVYIREVDRGPTYVKRTPLNRSVFYNCCQDMYTPDYVIKRMVDLANATRHDEKLEIFQEIEPMVKQMGEMLLDLHVVSDNPAKMMLKMKEITREET